MHRSHSIYNVCTYACRDQSSAVNKLVVSFWQMTIRYLLSLVCTLLVYQESTLTSRWSIDSGTCLCRWWLPANLDQRVRCVCRNDAHGTVTSGSHQPSGQWSRPLAQHHSRAHSLSTGGCVTQFSHTHTNTLYNTPNKCITSRLY